MPPKEHFFEQEIIKKHKLLSFQDPAKIADGLSLIWNENQKWKQIALKMAMGENEVRTTLKTICDSAIRLFTNQT